MIDTVPAVPPVTTPDVDTVAVVLLPVLQVPPVVVSVNAVVIPSHTVGVPPIVAGSAFTVTFAVAAQPLTGR